MKREPLTLRLQRLLPPNVDSARVRLLVLYSAALGLAVCLLDFAIRYSTAYRQLFYRPGPGPETELCPGALMLPFSAFAVTPLLVWGALAALALCSSALLYSSFYQGARSMYLMRRLPDGGRTLRRWIWAVPLRSAAQSLVTGATVLAVLFLLWRFITPEVCLPGAYTPPSDAAFLY